MSPDGEMWLDRDAGPVVRPYAVTRGRTRPAGAELGLIDVVAANPVADIPRGLGPEHRRLLDLCQWPAAVADLASDVDLPLGVVRVLLSDLTHHGLVRVVGAQARGAPAESVLRSVLNGLRTL
jgi:hypothetical protein